MFDFSVVIDALPQLLRGAGLTLYIAVLGIAGGTAAGFILGIARTYGPKAVNYAALTYIEIVRGTPIVVQVMFIYFALPLLLGIRLEGVTAAIIAITVNAAAYIAEIVRGSYLSVPNGLREAGLAMGLSGTQTLVSVISPIAVRRLIPPLGNQFIISLKDTSLFIVIGVSELTRSGQEIMATNFRAVEIWSTVAVLYLIMTLTLSGVLRLIERKAQIL